MKLSADLQQDLTALRFKGVDPGEVRLNKSIFVYNFFKFLKINIYCVNFSACFNND